VGLPAYEISNHARPGAECRHNLTYWRYGDYIGIGPGAHGRLTGADGAKVATRQHRAPEPWLARALDAGHATRTRTPLSWRERRDEMVMMGLRLREGIATAAFRRELGCDPHEALPAEALSALEAAGYLQREAGALQATAAGRLRLDAVLGYLLNAEATEEA
jgi:oxygen-independent coproporphyrinogen-3 oxidase